MPKNVLYIGIILLVFIACKPLGNIRQSAEIQVDLSTKQYIFPMDWIGVYEGDLHIIDNKGDSSKVIMQLRIDLPNASGFYPWIIIYGEDDIRSYGLEALHPEKGHYRFDEFNSIKIDAYLRGNHLISRFAVMQTDLIIDYEKTAEGILVHQYITRSNQYNESGGEIIGVNTVPQVASYPLYVFQSALLKTKSIK